MKRILIMVFVVLILFLNGCFHDLQDRDQERLTHVVRGVPLENVETDCETNVYNCADFSSPEEAQAMFERCGGVSNDIHNLDADDDGKACERWPPTPRSEYE